MTLKEMKKVLVEEFMGHLEEAREWEQKWINADRNEGNYHTYERLLDASFNKADGLLTTMKSLGWIDEEQRSELYADMLEVVYAD